MGIACSLRALITTFISLSAFIRLLILGSTFCQQMLTSHDVFDRAKWVKEIIIPYYNVVFPSSRYGTKITGSSKYMWPVRLWVYHIGAQFWEWNPGPWMCLACSTLQLHSQPWNSRVSLTGQSFWHDSDASLFFFCFAHTIFNECSCIIIQV